MFLDKQPKFLKNREKSTEILPTEESIKSKIKSKDGMKRGNKGKLAIQVMRKDSRIFHQESFGMSSQRKHQSKAFFAQQMSLLPHIIKEESPQKQKSVYSYQDNLLSPQPRSSRKYLQKDQLQELKNISPDYTLLENNLDNTVGGIMDNSITRLMPSFDKTVIIKDSLNNYTLPQPSQFNNNYRSQSTSFYQIQPNQNHQQFFQKILTLKATQIVDLQMQQAQSFATQDHQSSQNVQAYQQISQNSIEQPHLSNLNFMGLTARLSQSTFKLLDSYKPLLHKKQYDLEQIKSIPLSNMSSTNTTKIQNQTSNQKSTSNVKQSVQHQLPNKINDQFLQKKYDSNQQKSVVRQVIRRQMQNLGNKAGSKDLQNLNFNNDDIQHHLVSLENQSKDQIRKLVNKSRTLDIEQDNRESKQKVEQKRSQISKSTKLLLKSQSESRLSEVSNRARAHHCLRRTKEKIQHEIFTSSASRAQRSQECSRNLKSRLIY
eukprot:403377273